MPDDRRATRLAEFTTQQRELQRRRDELAERVPDPEQVRGPDGSLPADRRRANLGEYRARRQERVTALEAKITYLDAILEDTAAPKEVRRRARDARATAINELEAVQAEPSDDDLRDEDICPDGVHLAASHGYVWTSAHPAWPCAAWPGQRRIFDKVAPLLFDAPTRGDALNRWQLTLFCGHVVERTAHKSYPTYAAAGVLNRACETCGVDPAFVVDETLLGVAVAPPPTPPAPKSTSRSRKSLERRAAKLEAELAAVRAQLQAES
jgi:hypothetical protein